MNQPLAQFSSPDSLERIMTARKIALAKVREAKNAEAQAKMVLAQIGITPRFELQHERRSVNISQSDDDLARALNLDRDIWLALYRNVMGQVQTSTQREAQEQAIYEGNYPPVSYDTILDTLRSYQQDAEAAYIQSVYDFWASLHASYASNDHPSFEKKQVLSYACESSYPTHMWRLTRRVGGRLDDLTHIVRMYQTQGHDLELQNLPDAWNFSAHPVGQWIECGAFRFKLFKNGNMHLMIADDFRQVLNQTLATAAGKRLHSNKKR